MQGKPVTENRIEIEFGKITQLRQNKQYEESIYLLKNIITKQDTCARAYLLCGLSYMNTGRLVIALGYFRKYINLEPKEYIGWYLSGFCILKYTEYKGSIDYFKKAIELGGDFGDLWLWYGEALMRSGHAEIAFKCLCNATKGKISDLNRCYYFLFRSLGEATQKPILKLDYRSALVDRMKRFLAIDEIICVGDSHVLILEGINGLEVFQTGSPTAYNLLNPESTESGLSQIEDCIKDKDSKKTAILFTYAEIDIRNHIYKHIVDKSMNFETAVELVVERYLCAVRIFANKGFKILINGPFGSGKGVPRIGREHDRNRIAYLLDRSLQIGCYKNKFFYASLYNIIVDENYTTIGSFTGDVDDNHLDKAPELSFCLLSRFIDSIMKGVYNNFPIIQRIENVAAARTGLILNSAGYVKSPAWLTAEGSPTARLVNCNPNDQLLISLDNHYKVSEIIISVKNNQNIDSRMLKIIARDGDYIDRLITSSYNLTVSNLGDISLFKYNLKGSESWVWYLQIAPAELITLNMITKIEVFSQVLTHKIKV